MRQSSITLSRAGIVLALLIAPCLARAQETGDAKADDKEAAKERFTTGKALMKKEKFEVAAVEFKASIKLYPTKNALYNLSQCYHAVQDYEDALRTLDQLEDQFGYALSERMRASVDADRAKILALVAQVEIEVAQAGATVTVDGDEAGQSPLGRPVILKPGKHNIEISLDGHVGVKRQIFVDAGEERSESFKLAALPPPEPEPEPAEPVVAPKKPTNLKNTLFWVGVGGTVVSGTLAGIFWGLAASSYSDLRHNNGYIEDMYEDDPELPEVMSLAETARDKASRYNKLGVGFTVITVLFAAGTATIIADEYFGWELFGSEVAVLPDRVVVRF